MGNAYKTAPDVVSTTWVSADAFVIATIISRLKN